MSDSTGADPAVPAAPPPGRIIRRKIVAPPLGDAVVPRGRLELLLTGLLDQHRVLFVYASAGAGKTTAILQAAARIDRDLVWLDLDATDVATGRLLVYLEAALAVHVPEVEGIAAAALSAQVPHAEVAGLLADALGDHPVLIVFDDAERLATSPEALDVLAAFARYLPATARLVMASRTELPFSSSVGAAPWVAAIGEEDLALTVDEAAEALATSGRSDIDAVDAVVDTGGWVTGVLFEAWRATDHVIGLGGEADPLHGYLATEILGQLPAADAEFLVTTSVLEEVTASQAEALGVHHAAARMRALTGHRLPVAWQRRGTVMRSHPRFRDFLLERLDRRGDDAQRDLRRAHARLLLAEGHDEEAVQEFLVAGCVEDAFAVIAPVLDRVIERTDFALAESWLAALAPVRPVDDTTLAAAELLLAVAREDFAAGVELADGLHQHGRRGELAASSGRAAALMAWCYLHAGRVADIDEVLAVAPPGPDVDAARYSLVVVRDLPDRASGVAPGVLTGGPMDALVLRTHFDLGRLPNLTSSPSSPWAAKATESWRVSALLATGRTERAFELYHRLVASADQSVWLPAILGPRLMLEIGDQAEAWRLLREGRSRIAATGSAMFEVYSLLAEAEFELRLHRDLPAATAILDAIATHPVGRSYAFLAEQRAMLQGQVLLAAGRDAEALAELRRAVSGMQGGERLLYLVPAAVYLAEAEWRTGHEEAADSAAALALDAADRQGSHHYLLAALAEFPDVLARRLDLEPLADSPWHVLGRSLLVRGVPLAHPVVSAVEVLEYGTAAITVDGHPASPGLNKSVELLAYLGNHEREDVPREALLDALFDGRRDDAAFSYLRQAALKLRKVVPDVLDAAAPAGSMRLNQRLRVATESRRLIALLGEAAALRGSERLSRLRAALEIADRGPYLPHVTSMWAEERRGRLDELVRSARLEAAEVAFSVGDYQQATELVDQVVRTDPYREGAWRLQMRLAHTVGDHDRVISAYRACERALRELGAEPSASTVQLLQDLRP